MKTICVDPNQSHEVAVELDCAIDASVSWEFETVDGSPISFEVTLVHENNQIPTEDCASEGFDFFTNSISTLMSPSKAESPKMIESAILPYTDMNHHRGSFTCSFLKTTKKQSSKALLLLRVSSF